MNDTSDIYLAPLKAAQATIAELEKRIGELEESLEGTREALDEATAYHLAAQIARQTAEHALTAERQRREDCEAALVLIASCSDYYGSEPNPIPSYEAKYGPLPSEGEP